MKTAIKVGSLCLFVQCAQGQAIIDILPGTNNVPILSVNFTVDGNTVNQTSEATSVETRRDESVFLNSVTVSSSGGSTVLNSFNTLGGTVTNLNISPTATGVAVFDNGVVTEISNTSAFQTSLANITQDTDLLNFSLYDDTSGLPDSSTSDYDLLFARGLESDDFVLVSERNGNTFFTIVPLDGQGEVIAGANSLRFGGGETLGAHLAYDWRSGFATESVFPDQDFGFSVASVEKFFEGTDVEEQTVFGFRIDNDGDADVKFFGLSDNAFTDNPFNPNPTVIPEPTTVLLSAISSLLLFRRRR